MCLGLSERNYYLEHKSPPSATHGPEALFFLDGAPLNHLLTHSLTLSHTHSHTHTQTHTHTHTQIHSHTHTHTPTYTHSLHTDTYAHSHTHTDIYTYSLTHSLDVYVCRCMCRVIHRPLRVPRVSLSEHYYAPHHCLTCHFDRLLQ